MNRATAEASTVSAAVVFVLMAVVTVAFLLLGVPVLVLGMAVFILDGTTWPAVAGSATLAVAGATGWVAYLWLLACKRRFEAPRYRNQVFISYRTREHGEYARRLSAMLQAEGIGVFFADSGAVLLGSKPALPAFVLLRYLGFFQTGGLDADLQRGLIRSDALLYFVPTSARRIRLWQRLKDTLDSFGGWLVFYSGLTPTTWRFFWYAGMYNRRMMPALRLGDLQSWQAWELTLAEQLGLVVVKLIVDAEPEQLAEEIVLCRSETLESDFTTKVVGRLRDATRTELKVEGPLLLAPLAAVYFFVLKAVTLLSLLAVAVFVMARILFS